MRPSPEAFDYRWYHHQIYLAFKESTKGKVPTTYSIIIRGQMDKFDKGDGLCQIIFKPGQFYSGSVYEGRI